MSEVILCCSGGGVYVPLTPILFLCLFTQSKGKESSLF